MGNVYKRGSNGPYIKNIQRALNELNKAGLRRDGDFGPGTEAKLKDWQSVNGIPVDGVYAGRTAEILDAYIARRFITEQDFKDAATKLACEVNVVKSVQMVESSGEGFLADGRPVILFERHWFKKNLDAAMDADPSLAKALIQKFKLTVQAGQTFKGIVQTYLAANFSDIYNATPGGYAPAAANAAGAEHDRLNKAADIHKESALRAASWGLFQIMGFHYKSLKYASAADMVAAYNQGERQQLLSFCDFILIDPNLTKAVRNKDFDNFARYYNGPNYAINKYNEKMKNNYTALNAA